MRYAKSLDALDDKKSSSNLKIPALAGSSSKGLADKKSKIQLLEEQLKNLQERGNDFDLNPRNDSSPSEPLIKKYQYNKDLPTTSSSRHNYINKKRRKPY